MNMAFAALISLSLPSAPLASPSLDAKELETAELILKGMQDSRQRLLSGVCRIRGTRKDIRESHTIEEGLDLFCAFNFPEGLYRFDRNAPTQDGITKGGRSIRTPEHIYYTYGIDSEQLGGVMRDRVNSDTVGHIAPFDIRTVGLFNFVGPYWTKTFDDFYQGLRKGKLAAFSEEGQGVYRLTWAFEQAQVLATLWLDSTKGYSWIRYEVASQQVDSEKTVIETSWNEINGAWVPTAMRLTNDHWHGSRNEAEWTIEWESVNEAVPDEYFALSSFAPGRRVAVYSKELGDPVVVEYTDGSAPTGAPPVEQERRRWWIALTSTILLVLLVTAVLAVRLLRQRRGRADATDR
jgi:hypothetical protein